ncbi:MAG: prepilin-type N-terminal cleavage/methylation domain-containing protein [Agathobacter sp.]|nr:prepilin-type N-terminal cleavage/methylation domain-containing protein [Agathobacter sp.]
MKRIRKGNQKGFSLVELIVAMAILAIASGAIVGFLRVASHFYQNVSSDVDLQYESQQAINQMESLLVDSTKGVSFQSDTLMIYADNIRHSIRWDAASNRLYYSKAEYSKKEDGSFEFKSILTEDALMAEYVSGFSVSFDSTADSQIVILTLDMKKASKEYHVSQKVTLRNNVLVNQKEEDLYDESKLPTVSSVEIWYAGQEVVTDSMEFRVSDSKTDLFSVVVKGANNPSIDVTWNLTGDKAMSEGTKLELTRGGAIIQVGEDEENSTLFLEAVSKVDSNRSDKIAITLIRRAITGITITGPEKVYKNTEFEFTITVTGNEYLKIPGDVKLELKEITGAEIESGPTWDSVKEVYIGKAKPKQGADKVCITYGAKGTDKEGSFSKDVSNKHYSVSIVEDSSSTDLPKDPDVIWRNQSKTFKVVATADDGSSITLDSNKIKWSYTAYYGQTVNNDKKNSSVVKTETEDPNDATYTITTNTYVNKSNGKKKFVFNEEYCVVIDATVTLPDDADETIVTTEKKIDIPKVSCSPSDNRVIFKRTGWGYNSQWDSGSFFLNGVVLNGQNLSWVDSKNQERKVWVWSPSCYNNTVFYYVQLDNRYFNERTFTLYIDEKVTPIKIYVDGK